MDPQQYASVTPLLQRVASIPAVALYGSRSCQKSEGFAAEIDAFIDEEVRLHRHTRFMMPLLGMPTPERDVTLPNDVIVHPLSCEEAELLLNSPSFVANRDAQGSYVECRTALCANQITQWDARDSIGVWEDRIRERFETTRSALTLHSDTCVMAPGLIKGSQIGFPVLWSSGQTNEAPRAGWRQPILSPEETDQLESNVSRLVSAIGNKSAQFASSRLLAAGDRANEGDMLVDAWTLIEALLSSDRSELRLRLSLRVAVLLGRNWPERDRVFRDAMSAYKVRSDLVHGGGPAAHFVATSAWSMLSAGRAAFRALIDAGHFGLSRNQRDRVLCDLDQSIFALE